MPTVYLTVPGVTNSSENHWQSRWEREFPEKFRRIEQTEWDSPVCDDWTVKIETDVQNAGPENIVLVAHSLGCAAVAHWAKSYSAEVKGAMLVAPSDVEAETYAFETTGFAPIPLVELPFKSLVVTSSNDEYVSLERAKQFADAWGSDFVNVGEKGHINPGSGYGEWNEGLELLKGLG